MNETRTWRSIFGSWFERVDRQVTRWMARQGVTLLRVSIGIIFFWFGALKLIPGASPAAALIRESWGFVEVWGIMPMGVFMTILALWEMLIGLGFISGKFLRAAILLMALQMVGAVSPVVLQPSAAAVSLRPDAGGAVHRQERCVDLGGLCRRGDGARRRHGRRAREDPGPGPAEAELIPHPATN
jgi:uncharacterized membrane protein YphA (DoxX/SURF4 family)